MATFASDKPTYTGLTEPVVISLSTGVVVTVSTDLHLIHLKQQKVMSASTEIDFHGTCVHMHVCMYAQVTIKRGLSINQYRALTS